MIIPALLLLALGGLAHVGRSFGTDASSGVLMSLGYLMLSALLAGKLASRIGLPKLTGYLLLGIVAGPHVLDLVSEHATSSLTTVRGTAVCLIGLTVGGELDFGRLRPLFRTLRAIALYGIVGTMVALAAVMFAIRPLIPPLAQLPAAAALAVCGMIGIALSAQSPSTVIALLAETRSDGPLSRVVLGSAIVSDLVVVLLYAVTTTLAAAAIGTGLDPSNVARSVAWELLGSIAAGLVIGMILGAFVRVVRGGAALFTTLICVVAAEIGSRIHLDPLLVMLAAGVWLQNFSRASALLHDIESARLPLFLVFFSLAGTHIDLRLLAASAVPVSILVVARALSFHAGNRFACRASGAPDVVTRYAWVGHLPQSGLALSLALLIRETYPSFGDAVSVVMFGVVGANELVAPVILRRVLVGSGESTRKAVADFATARER